MSSHSDTNRGRSDSRRPMKIRVFDRYLKRELKDEAFRKGYEEEKQKLGLGYQIFLARQKAGMTQAELARLIGTRQSNISRFEQGNYNFTVEMLGKIAAALNRNVDIRIRPHKKAA